MDNQYLSQCVPEGSWLSRRPALSEASVNMFGPLHISPNRATARHTCLRTAGLWCPTGGVSRRASTSGSIKAAGLAHAGTYAAALVAYTKPRSKPAAYRLPPCRTRRAFSRVRRSLAPVRASLTLRWRDLGLETNIKNTTQGKGSHKHVL